MWEARRLAQKNDWGLKALKLNDEILRRNPDNLPALTRRGRCHRESEDYPAAERDYLMASAYSRNYRELSFSAVAESLSNGDPAVTFR